MFVTSRVCKPGVPGEATDLRSKYLSEQQYLGFNSKDVTERVRKHC